MKYAIPTAITAGVLTLGLAWQPAMGEAGQASAYPDVEIDPQLDPRGELLQPRGFRTWVFIGAPLTPNALNDGAAGFPELHTSMSATLAAAAPLRVSIRVASI